MTINPLIKFFKIIPDKCSIALAAKVFGLDIERFLDWAHEHSIRLFIDLDTGVPIIGDGEEINVHTHFYAAIEPKDMLESDLVQQELIKQSLSIITIVTTEDKYHDAYAAEGRWIFPPCHALDLRKSGIVKTVHLLADFSMMCGVELDQPHTVDIRDLSIARKDLELIALHLKTGEPLPSIYNGGLEAQPDFKKPRKQREEPIYRKGLYQLSKHIFRTSEKTSIAAEHQHVAALLAINNEEFAIGLDAFTQWHPNSKSEKKLTDSTKPK
tara:strand:- start:62946 stop:63752 length:807 start_codon:yes stop_codon:yes gene_type:complete